MSELLSALQVVAAIASGWILVSVVTTAALLPVFRTMARVSAVEKLEARAAEWAMSTARVR